MHVAQNFRMHLQTWTCWKVRRVSVAGRLCVHCSSAGHWPGRKLYMRNNRWCAWRCACCGCSRTEWSATVTHRSGSGQPCTRLVISGKAQAWDSVTSSCQSVAHTKQWECLWVQPWKNHGTGTIESCGVCALSRFLTSTPGQTRLQKQILLCVGSASGLRMSVRCCPLTLLSSAVCAGNGTPLIVCIRCSALLKEPDWVCAPTRGF